MSELRKQLDEIQKNFTNTTMKERMLLDYTIENIKQQGKIDGLEYKILRLEQENKELKEFFDSTARKNTSLENKIKEYHEQYDELYWTTDQLVEDKTRLKQTLEEIKEIAMRIMDDDIDEGSGYYDANQIINKINEVLQ